MIRVVVDAGGLISAVNERSSLHRETREVLDRLREENARLVVSPFVLAEIDYLLSEREGRPDVALEVLRDVARGGYHLKPFGSEDLDRADQNIGLADAANVVLAERHDTLNILTTDERHFRVLSSPGGNPFRLLPADKDS
ncbi:MAG: PIN domain-containing protein [Rubrobacteraceae bacterium]